MKTNVIKRIISGLATVMLDFVDGKFPPKRTNQSETWKSEFNEMDEDGMRSKPFAGEFSDKYILDFLMVRRLLCKHAGFGARVLEIGCGSGWMSIFLQRSGFQMIGTDLPHAIDWCIKNNLDSQVGFAAEMMDDPNGCRNEWRGKFNAVLFYSAIHHAHSWEIALLNAKDMLAPGGCILLCAEPSTLHTLGTWPLMRDKGFFEIGLNRRMVKKHLIEKCECKSLTEFWPSFSDWFMPFKIIKGHFVSRPIWIVAKI